MILVYPVTPAPAPRQTRSDIWNPSGQVVRYRAFRDEINLRIKDLPKGFYHVVFIIPMPKSWSKKKRREMTGKPHKSKPDKDNLEKALVDAVFRGRDDAHVWNSASSKLWGYSGSIIISDCFLNIPPDGLSDPVIYGNLIEALLG